ncbi:EAL domain-containing protein [Nitrincola alkalilacustris]|uniref:EAL domain-containing protein n=1 Tax=Nitrincola alkalilacustris TaxID=1571224 RepID=UPI00124D81AB|nr:EAL domain-containing protein [Nitrincola alkalilacustris]
MSEIEQCSCSKALGFKIRMAYQPIIDVRNQQIFAQEALVRGEQGESAGEVLGRISDKNVHSFDQLCRVTAITTAARLGLDTRVSINFLPNAIYKPETCIARTLEAARKFSVPSHNIMFEVAEHERITSHSLLLEVFECYKAEGFLTAIDDFGQGYAGLNLLADFQPDYIKLDRQLISFIDQNRARQVIVKGIVSVAEELGIGVIAEGIEREEEHCFLVDQGVYLMQGYLYQRPALEQLMGIGQVHLPVCRS